MQKLQQNPLVNAKSLKLLENSGYYQKKVEDRLIEIGEKWKDKKEEKLQRYLVEVDQRAFPVITTNQSFLNLNDQMLFQIQISFEEKGFSAFYKTLNFQSTILFQSKFIILSQSVRLGQSSGTSQNLKQMTSQFQMPKNHPNQNHNLNIQASDTLQNSPSKSINKIKPQKNFEERLKHQMEKKEKMLELLKKKHEGSQNQRQIIGGIVDQRVYDQINYQFEERQKVYEQNKRHNQIKIIDRESSSQLNTKSIEKFLERQNQAKQLKLEHELIQENRFGSGNKWKNNLTVAKAPSFMREYYENVKSLSPNKASVQQVLNQKQKSQQNQFVNNSKPNIDIQQQLDFYGNSSKNLEQVPQTIQNDNLLQTIQEEIELNSKNNTLNFSLNQESIQNLNQPQFIQNQQLFSSQQNQQQQQMYNNLIGQNNNNNQAMMNSDGQEYGQAMNFLHEQLHKIEFSFDQQQQLQQQHQQ